MGVFRATGTVSTRPSYPHYRFRYILDFLTRARVMWGDKTREAHALGQIVRLGVPRNVASNGVYW
jgi:hypothetical protein